MKILYLEDEREKVFDLFMLNFNDAFEDDAEVKIDNPQTYDDGKKLFEDGNYDVLILDMSIPKNKSDLQIGKPDPYGGLKLLKELNKTDHFKRLDPKVIICSGVEKAVTAAEFTDLDFIQIEKDGDFAENIIIVLKKIKDDESYLAKEILKNKFKNVLALYEKYQKAESGIQFINLIYEAKNEPIMRDWSSQYNQFLDDTLKILADYIFLPPETYTVEDHRPKRSNPEWCQKRIFVNKFIWNDRIAVKNYVEEHLKDKIPAEYYASILSSWDLSNTIKHYYNKNYTDKIKRIETGTAMKVLLNQLIFFMEFLVENDQVNLKTDKAAVDEHENLESTEADAIIKDEEAIDDSIVDEDTDEITSVDEEDSNEIDKNSTDE